MNDCGRGIRVRQAGVRAVGALAPVIAALALIAPTARADFPYTGPTGNVHDPTTWKLPPGVAPTNFGDDWKLAATPEQSPQSDLLVNGKTDELCGIRGMGVVDANAIFPAGTNSCVAAATPVKTAFEYTLGRPDVLISELDSGIKWNDTGAMIAVRKKIWLNPGELPAPRDDMMQSFDPSTGVNCAAHYGAVGSGGNYNPAGGTAGAGGVIPYDILDQGVFNVLDYACDSRVAAVVDGPSALHALRHGPPGMLVPEDLILAFSDGIDHDHDGFANDIAGWNFVDNNNDPYDDVQYGHGTGEVQDSAGEANTSANSSARAPTARSWSCGSASRSSPTSTASPRRCCTRPTRASSVIQEPLGTLNNSYFGASGDRVRLPPRHGRDRLGGRRGRRAQQPALGAARHDRRQLASNKYSTETQAPPSYLQLNGCTNFGPKVTVSVSSSSCSSNATGLGAGHRRPDLQRGDQRDRRGQAQARERLHPRRRHPLPDHAQRGPPADGLGQHRRRHHRRRDRRPARARPRRTRGTAARPTTSTSPSSPSPRASRRRPPRARTPTTTPRSPPTCTAASTGPRPTPAATPRARASTSSTATGA